MNKELNMYSVLQDFLYLLGGSPRFPADYDAVRYAGYLVG